MDASARQQHRQQAIIVAQAATSALASLGVNVVVTGSLARGRFRHHSDIDLLVTACPRHLKYAIEGIVEDTMAGLPFDVIYLDEVPPWRLRRFSDGSVHASELR